MDYILSLESSTEVCSVALHRAGGLVANACCHRARVHHKMVVKMAHQVLDMGEVKPTDLQAVAVSHGPGSYTGLRIGFAVAKGLAYGLDIPIITVNTLQLLAYEGLRSTGRQGEVAALLDARKGRVYMMKVDPTGKVLVESTVEEVASSKWLTSTKGQPLYIVGDGAVRYADVLKKREGICVIHGCYPNASHMGALAYEKYTQKGWEELVYVAPLYL
ncbi:MAG: tRNA (adenosine(37)-N6)-threonylcarbamoyltransferase complex dimerization subunit type 1 TsaB [Bacteroidota bacterium]